MIQKKINKLLRNREFVNVATCDLKGRPNAAPKFFLKVENNFMYLVDYAYGNTLKNIKINPRASLSFLDPETLIGYQINGPVEIIESGTEYDSILKELLDREIDLSAKRIIEGVERGRIHKGFEVEISEKFAILKVKMQETAEVGPAGSLKKENI